MGLCGAHMGLCESLWGPSGCPMGSEGLCGAGGPLKDCRISMGHGVRCRPLYGVAVGLYGVTVAPYGSL